MIQFRRLVPDSFGHGFTSWTERIISEREYKQLQSTARESLPMNQYRKSKVPCVICGSVDSEAHHPDYREPVKVVWLCRKHHKCQHRRPRDTQFLGQFPLVLDCNQNGTA